jgi:hypothetical protein
MSPSQRWNQYAYDQSRLVRMATLGRDRRRLVGRHRCVTAFAMIVSHVVSMFPTIKQAQNAAYSRMCFPCIQVLKYHV